MTLAGRKWAVGNASSRSNLFAAGFSLMTYNVLSPILLKRHPFLYKAPSHHLDWKYRSRLIVQEICELKPDVVCLQEVEPDAFANDFEHGLREEYKGIYCRRLGNTVDGCAVFWRKDSLKLIHSQNIDFKRITNKDNIAIIAVFERIPPNGQDKPDALPLRFCVSTTHLLFNTNRGYLKLAQLHELVSKLDEVSTMFGGIHVIMTGDFNMTEESAAYHYVATGETEPFLFNEEFTSGQNRIPQANGKMTPYCYPYDILQERKRLRAQEVEAWGEPNTYKPVVKVTDAYNANYALFDFLSGETGILKHRFQFEDAVLGRGGHGDKRYYSTHHQAAQSLVDFVFFSPPPTSPSTDPPAITSSASIDSSEPASTPKLIALEFLEPPVVNTSQRRNHVTPMPNKNTPSDHIPLVVKFGFMDEKK
ncbi:hypothetical protein HDU98_003195 [Podochytrium sp. JEL0797]|nr:hypothetical protein HDU98_003195 [Podochytrium sp. JEL0797]